MNAQELPIARRNDLVIQELPGETLVYDLNTHRAFCLNESAAFVWRCCDGHTSIQEIVRNFESTGRGSVSDEFVWLAISQLSDEMLLESSIQPSFSGVTRRQLIRRIGLASTVAVPIIASIVAPKNAFGNVNCACTSPAQCQTQTGCPSRINCNVSGICAP
jgi:hypothetical protein